MVYPMSEPSAAVSQPGPDYGYTAPFNGPNEAWSNLFDVQKVATVRGNAEVTIEPSNIFLVDRR